MLVSKNYYLFYYTSERGGEGIAWTLKMLRKNVTELRNHSFFVKTRRILNFRITRTHFSK